VAGLDGHDGAGGGQQARVLEELAGPVVGGDAGVLQRRGRRQEGGGVGDAEVVGGLLDRLAAEVGDDGGQGLDVGALVVADEAEVVVDGVAEAVDAEVVGSTLSR
jgi:hypothetical protein